MAPWGWLIGYLVLFALLHLLLYYVYVRKSENGGSPSALIDGNGPRTPYSPTDNYADVHDDGDRSERDVRYVTGVDSDDETIQCPHCGTINVADRSYTYCRRCVSTLRR